MTQAFAMSPGGAVEVQAVGGEALLAWLSDTPWREPLVMHGPFGMNDAAQLTATIRSYQASEMGRLEPMPL